MLYTIKNEYLSVTVNSKGGSMTSLKYLPCDDERLWQGGEFWSGQDVVIFPIIGHAGEFTVCGKKFTPKSHGVARYSEFSLENLKDNELTLTLKSDTETRKTYPFDFILSVNYKLTGKTLTVTYIVKAVNDRIPFYVGGHPGLKAPRGEAVIEFENEENAVIYPVNTDEAYFENKLKRFTADKEFFKRCKTYQVGNLSGGAVCAETADGYRYTYKSDCPVYAFWSNEDGGDYVCVEPWWGINDIPCAPRELSLKPFVNFAGTNGKEFAYSLNVDKINRK